MKKTNTRRLVFTSMMAAIVYITSAFLQISIPTVIGSTRLHMGNVMCLLSGMLLGPLYGGIAAGVGSMLFDLTNPTYISSAPFTLVFKFGMAWLCGKIVFSLYTSLDHVVCGNGRTIDPHDTFHYAGGYSGGLCTDGESKGR